MEIKTKEFHSVTTYKVFEVGEKVKFGGIPGAATFTATKCMEPTFPDDDCVVFTKELRFGIDSESLVPVEEGVQDNTAPSSAE